MGNCSACDAGFDGTVAQSLMLAITWLSIPFPLRHRHERPLPPRHGLNTARQPGKEPPPLSSSLLPAMPTGQDHRQTSPDAAAPITSVALMPAADVKPNRQRRLACPKRRKPPRNISRGLLGTGRTMHRSGRDTWIYSICLPNHGGDAGCGAAAPASSANNVVTLKRPRAGHRIRQEYRCLCRAMTQVIDPGGRVASEGGGVGLRRGLVAPEAW